MRNYICIYRQIDSINTWFDHVTVSKMSNNKSICIYLLFKMGLSTELKTNSDFCIHNTPKVQKTFSASCQNKFYELKFVIILFVYYRVHIILYNIHVYAAQWRYLLYIIFIILDLPNAAFHLRLSHFTAALSRYGVFDSRIFPRAHVLSIYIINIIISSSPLSF